MLPLVSIIVPVYNVEHYVGFCISSLTKQTYTNIEIILVDDGSTDGSTQLCQEAAKLDHRIKFERKKNGGLSSARNYGLTYASGDYVVFVDGDDIVSPVFIQTLVEASLESDAPVSIVQAGNVMNPEAGLRIRFEATATRIVMTGLDALESMLENREISTSACGKMASLDVWRKHSFPEGRVYEDLAVVFGVLGDADKVVLSDIPLYGQVIRPGSITRQRSFSQKQVQDYYLAISDCYNGVIEKWPSCEPSARVRKLLEFSRLQRISRNCPEKDPHIVAIDKEVSVYLRKGIANVLRIRKMKPADRMKVALSVATPGLFGALFWCNEKRKVLLAALHTSRN